MELLFPHSLRLFIGEVSYSPVIVLHLQLARVIEDIAQDLKR